MTEPLNMATIDELRDILEEGFDDLIAEYLEDAPRNIARLQEAAASGALDDFMVIAHTLKGSSGNLGIEGVYRLCMRLEQQARDGDPALEMVPEARAVAEEFARAREALVQLRVE